MGDFLAIVKEKNFIEVVSRSINQVDMLVNSSRKYIIVQGDYHHGGRPQGRKSQPRECDRQPGKRGEHGLAKSCSREVLTILDHHLYYHKKIKKTTKQSGDRGLAQSYSRRYKSEHTFKMREQN